MLVVGRCVGNTCALGVAIVAVYLSACGGTVVRDDAGAGAPGETAGEPGAGAGGTLGFGATESTGPLIRTTGGTGGELSAEAGVTCGSCPGAVQAVVSFGRSASVDAGSADARADAASLGTGDRWCFVDLPALPRSYTFDPQKVNVTVTTSGDTETIPNVPSSTSCKTQSSLLAWYYDDPVNPKRIGFCPDTCERLERDAAGMVTLRFGCNTHCISN